MTEPLTTFLETRLALWQLLRIPYVTPPTEDLHEALSEAVSVYSALTGHEIPPLHPLDSAGESPEFHRLFIGPAALVAPPFESVYRSPEQCLMQEETLRVRSFYRQHGLTLPADLHEPDDHLGYELEFYTHLQRQVIEALARGESTQAARQIHAQQRFYAEHLKQWLPAFCRRLIDGTRSPFYRSLGRITRELLNTERPVLAALVTQIPVKEEDAV